MPDLHRLGLNATPRRIADIVDSFRSTVDVRAGLVIPWDHPASAGDLDLDAEQTLAGTLWSSTASCSWRVEGDRATVAILADEALSLPGLPLERVTCEVADGPPVAWLRQPFTTGGDVGAMVPRRYLIDGLAAHERLALQEV